MAIALFHRLPHPTQSELALQTNLINCVDVWPLSVGLCIFVLVVCAVTSTKTKLLPYYEMPAWTLGCSTLMYVMYVNFRNSVNLI